MPLRSPTLLAVSVSLFALGLAGCPDNSARSDDFGTAEAPAVREGGTDRPKELVIGLTPYLSPEQMKDEFEPLAEHITAVTGVHTTVRVAKTYSEVSQLINTYQVHIAVFSPFSYVTAKRDNPGLILLGTHIADGSSTYSAYIITQEESGIETVDQLKGKSFGFVDRTSASGYLYPLAYLRSLGHEPETFFSGVEFAGNHPTLIARVLSKELDAGATFSTAYKNAENKRLRIIAKTGRIPYDAYCASPRLDQALVQQIRSTLLKLSTRTEEGRKILGRLTNINGFVAVGDDHYDEVRRVVRLVEKDNGVSP